LTKAGSLHGSRGKGGGYRLAQDPAAITVGRVLEAAGEDLSPVACLSCNPNNCVRSSSCRTLPMWQELQANVQTFFRSYTIAGLCNSGRGGNDYVI
jgi:Rrf2 family protein